MSVHAENSSSDEVGPGVLDENTSDSESRKFSTTEYTDSNSEEGEATDNEESDTAVSNNTREDPVLGRWPRRLLHIRSMTSYEWQPGNFYGGYKEPNYNIVSYTWGRYSLKEGKKLHIKAIGIKNVTWEIPRINEDAHFSVTEFQNMIWNAGVTDPNQPSRVNNPSDQVHFIWLDVACIDQNDGSREKGLEIGRQAIIFQHAASSFIWLSHVSLEELQEITRELREAAGQGPPVNLARGSEHFEKMQIWLEKWLSKILKHLENLLQEPWFTSLWTLQEAYLRPFSSLLCKDGRPAPKTRDWYEGNENLRSLTLRIMEISSLCNRSLALGCSRRKDVERTLRLIEKLGAGPVLRVNPIALFQASSNRQTYNVLDRVYGIMQVFGFRVGSADPSFPEDKLKKLSLTELELLFSKELLKRYPVQSQLNVFTSLMPPGRAWRMSPSSKNPSFARIASMYTFASRGQQSQIPKMHKIRSLYTISPESTPDVRRSNKQWLFRYFPWADLTKPDSITWCEVSGIACRFSILQQTWERVHGQKDFTKDQIAINIRNPQHKLAKDDLPMHEIALDLKRKPMRSQLIIPFLPRFPLVGFEIEGNKQMDLARRISQAFERHEIMVLALGTQKRPTTTLGRTNYGMILVKKEWKGMNHWHRIGVVSWEVFDLPRKISDADKALLEIRCNDWRPLKGKFG